MSDHQPPPKCTHLDDVYKLEYPPHIPVFRPYIEIFYFILGDRKNGKSIYFFKELYPRKLIILLKMKSHYLYS
jgi:hypothetical protein